ncbi:MAG: hypothetical protein ACFB0D_16040 [Phormidesmis sp.]
MVTSLNKFRTQYPEGGLVAELVSIHDGQYVVRAVASSQGNPLGSGLASSVDVQIAEDKARDRALAVLGIFADGSQPTDAPSKPAPTSQKTESTAKPTTEKKVLVVSELPDTTLTSTGQQTEILQNSDDLTKDDLTKPEELVTEDEEDLGPPIDDVKEEPPTPPDNKVSAAVIALENFNASAMPVDLSDVIAQTDVELTRLGWTSVQGREYLEKTYGKRSRQQLTDEELMSFLLYLEEQS